jgi:hypothetical protein
LRDWRQNIESDAVKNFLSEKEEIQLRAIIARHSAMKENDERGRLFVNKMRNLGI